MATELFVVGNGLDLQCGLGTTYENFLKFIFSNIKNEELNMDNSDDLSIVARKSDGTRPCPGLDGG